MGCTDPLRRGVGAPHQCPLGSVASYLQFISTDVFANSILMTSSHSKAPGNQPSKHHYNGGFGTEFDSAAVDQSSAYEFRALEAVLTFQSAELDHRPVLLHWGVGALHAGRTTVLSS